MATDLVTVKEYKSYLGISSTTQDDLIASLITKTSQLVKKTCRRTFNDYVDEFKVEISKGGSNRILLQETPIIQVASVDFSEDFGNTYTTLTELQDYVVDQEADAIELIAYPYIDYKKVNAFKVTYTAGYEEIPPDLKLAVFDLVHYYIRNDSAIHSSKAVGANTVQIEYITNVNLPAHIRRVLDLHTAYYG